MARTINGNLTGKAAHGHDFLDDVPTETALTRKAMELKELMQDEFWSWYVGVNIHDKIAYEAALDSKYFEWAEIYADVMAEVYALPEAITLDLLATVGDWASYDPRTPEQRELDMLAAEQDDWRSMLLGC